MSNNIMYIARDEGIYDEDYNYVKPGKLQIFYDTPLPYCDGVTKTCKYGKARVVAEIPTYMYPDIQEGECYAITLDGSKLYHKINLD